MNLPRALRKLRSCWNFFSGKAGISYSQVGEDLIIDYIFKQVIKAKSITYLDIGTNDPIIGNNTYLFYLKNDFGVCLEPDPILYKKIVAKRTRDVVLNAGIGTGEQTEGTLYRFLDGYSGWNTFSKEEAEKRHQESKIQYHQYDRIPFLKLNDVIQKYFNPYPDFISIDVEGLDLQILKTMDFTRFRPIVFCVETIDFSPDNKGKKNTGAIDLLLSNGYEVYADTYVNTIFIRKDILNK